MTSIATNAAPKRGQRLRKQRVLEEPQGSMCRICMRWDQASRMVRLFTRLVHGQTLAEAVSHLGAVDVLERDRLPKLCCKRCLLGIEQACKLKKLCQESDRKLRNLYPDVEVVPVKMELENSDETVALEAEQISCIPDVQIEEKSEVSVTNELISVEQTISPKLELDEATIEHPIIDVKTEKTTCNESSASDDNIESNDINSDDEEDQDDEKGELQSQENRKTKIQLIKAKFPDVFDEVVAVGISCCGCKHRFNSTEELQAHTQSVHAINKRLSGIPKHKKQCEVCYKVLTIGTFKNHSQKGKYDFRCKTCGDIFPNRKRVCTHHQRMHGSDAPKYRLCCGCSQKFDTAEALKAHTEAVHLTEKLPHDDTRPFVCNICFRNFSSDMDLYKHQTRLIKYSKTHQCVQCGKTFIFASLLRDHEIFHSGEKVFQCTECPMSYSNKDSFRKHIQRHAMPADKFQCKICNRCFKSKKSLKEHELAHSGERPLACPYCPARYARDTCLLSHIRTHTGQKDYQCSLCDKRFARSSERNQHVKLYHEKARPFPCFFCTKRYPRKDYRRKHMESVHQTELKTNPVPAIELAGTSQWM